MFHTVLICSNVLSPIDPLFFTVALLDIIFKLAFVLAPIDVSVFAIPVGHIVLKLATVHITFSMPESPVALRFVVIPLALIMGAVGPILDAVSMPKLILVLCVGSAIVVVRHPSDVVL